jgi:hypothetical protein
METNFNDIQQLWQSQKAASFDFQALIEGLKKTEEKQKRERTAITIITPVTLSFLFWVMPWGESKTILMSILVIAVAMVWVAWMSFCSKVNPSDDSANFSNKEYLQTQLKKLNQRYKIAGTYMYCYAFLLAAAINVAYFVLLAPLSNTWRISIHVGLTVILFVVMHISIRMRIKKYDQTLKPIMNQLEKLLADIKN